VIINAANLQLLYQSLSVLFQDAFGQVTPTYSRIAMEVPSTTRQENYAWLGKFPKMREWLGDRVVQSVAAHNYAIANRDWEVTIEVDRNDIEDDTIGLYRPIVQETGRGAASHPDELVWGLLPQGFTAPCYDGKAFFAADHPMGGGSAGSNYASGSATPWYLISSQRPIKPMIFQNRRAPNFVAITRPDDESVFMKKKFMYGVDRRDNAGFGLWQLAYGAKNTMNGTNYAAARAAMLGYKDEEGRPLGIVPDLLIVPPSLEAAGRMVVKAERDASGASNVWYQTADLLVVPWLS
jgi:phage major head subunit gpT-like protein